MGEYLLNHCRAFTERVTQDAFFSCPEDGNTDGEMSLETTIVISQFQAQNGMAVTGEVTPQLVGLLAAKVDAN